MGKHSQTIPIKCLVSNFAVQTKFEKNDQLSSNSMPMVHKGATLLPKNKVLLAKTEKKVSLRDTQHVLSILKIYKSNTHPLRFVVLYSDCHQCSTSTALIASSPLLLLCSIQMLVDY